MVDLVVLQSVSYVAAAVGVCVAAVYYAMVLREQRRNMRLTLETRKLQLITGLAHDLFNEEGVRRWGELLNMEWSSYDDFERKYGSDVNLDNYAKRQSVFYTFNAVGTLIREKLVEPETLYKLEMVGASLLWAKFEDVIREQRRRYMGADFYQELELLAKEMMRIKLKRDSSYKLPETFLKYVPEK